VRLSTLGDCINRDNLFIKRDDLLGRVLGGNKLRKLEYILPIAVEQGADTLITTGSFESNHVCLTVAAAKQLGMHPAMVLMGLRGEQMMTLNERIQRRLGADIRTVYFDPDDREYLGERVDQAVQELTKELEDKGQRPFFVPPAGCCMEGTYAFVKAFDELHEQMRQEGYNSYDIVLAVGTGSTFSGLWCGAKRINADVSLHGISIARQNPRCIEETIKAASRVCDELDLPIPSPQELNISDGYIGSGYAKPTEYSQRAIQLALEREGILLDNTYAGKALGGLLDMLEKDKLGSRPIVFWHTGGVAGSIDSFVESLE
jgi:1-aminocyclopropane-1-carboxylate deaminase/D-cysteine desulfhydrase-like pyridoxal-dependent ACC family enzyme